MSSLTFFVVVVAIASIFWSPAKVLAVITLLLVAGGNPTVAIFALLFLAVLFYLTKIKWK
jgi:hypothetical protein